MFDRLHSHSCPLLLYRKSSPFAVRTWDCCIVQLGNCRFWETFSHRHIHSSHQIYVGASLLLAARWRPFDSNRWTFSGSSCAFRLRSRPSCIIHVPWYSLSGCFWLEVAQGRGAGKRWRLTPQRRQERGPTEKTNSDVRHKGTHGVCKNHIRGFCLSQPVCYKSAKLRTDSCSSYSGMTVNTLVKDYNL